MYEFSSRVRYSEIGPDMRMTPVAMITRFQDCGVFQLESLGRGPAVWANERRAWIIISWQVKILRLPRFGSVVTARTIPYRFHGFEGDRNYELYAVPYRPDAASGNMPLRADAAGPLRDAGTGTGVSVAGFAGAGPKEAPDDGASPAGGSPGSQEPVLCAVANSRWVFYDMEERHPIRVPAEEKDVIRLDEPLDMEYAPRKIVLPDAEPELRKPVLVTETFIDTNRHVNNLQYIEMACAYIPEDFEIRELRVEYVRQCMLGETLYPRVIRDGGRIYVSLDLKGGETCAVVEFM